MSTGTAEVEGWGGGRTGCRGGEGDRASDGDEGEKGGRLQ